MHIQYYMHIIAINEKEAVNMKGEQKGAYERAWRDEGERRNVIKLQSQK